MGLVDDEHDPAVPLGRLGSQQVGRLHHELGLQVPRLGTK